MKSKQVFADIFMCEMCTNKFFFLQVLNLYDNSLLMILLFALATWQEKHFDFHVHGLILFNEIMYWFQFKIQYCYTVNFRYFNVQDRSYSAISGSRCLIVTIAYLSQDLRSNNNMSPLDSSGSTAESYTSDTTLSAGSPTHQFSSSQELNDSGQLATPSLTPPKSA